MSRILLLLLFLCAFTNAVASELSVIVSVLPQKLFVERLGGELVTVRVMVRKGYDPATYEPAPEQIAALGNADVYVRSGVPFEDSWMPRIASVNADLLLLDMREGVELIPLDAAHHGRDVDPHIWTDPVLVQQHVTRLRDTLIELLPAHANTITANHSALQLELQRLDKELASQLASVTRRQFLVFHPAWGYFARRYGFEQVAVEHEGKEPTARELVALISLGREINARFILSQPQQNARTAHTLADAIGAKVVLIDPLSEDYFSGMREMARILAAEDE